MQAFEAYINQVKDAGLIITVISVDSDLLCLCGDIYYQGVTPVNVLQQQVADAINNYIGNLPFNGVFSTTSLIKAICSVDGICEVDITKLEATIAYNTTPQYQAINVQYVPFSGCLQIDPNFPLNTKLNFIQK